MALIVRGFSISKLMETYAGGDKQSEFLNMKFESDVSLTPERAIVEQLEAHRVVEEAITFNALASGMMTKEAAKDKLEQIKERHKGILAVLQDRYGITDPQSFLGTAEIDKSDE